MSAAVASNVALSGTRVRYRVDAEHAEERILTWDSPNRAGSAHLSLLSPRGLALLGVCPGESVEYRTERGRAEFLMLEQVSLVEKRRPVRIVGAPTHDMLDTAPPRRRRKERLRVGVQAL